MDTTERTLGNVPARCLGLPPGLADMQCLNWAEYSQPNLAAAIDAARGFCGAKWRHLGRKPWAMDCIGLVIMALEAGGIKMRDRTNYGRYPWQDGLDHDMIAHFGQPLPLSEMQEGDIVLMRWAGDPACGHVGLIVNGKHDMHVIHSYSMIAVTEHRIDAQWLSNMERVYRPDWGRK